MLTLHNYKISKTFVEKLDFATGTRPVVVYRELLRHHCTPGKVVVVVMASVMSFIRCHSSVSAMRQVLTCKGHLATLTWSGLGLTLVMNTLHNLNLFIYCVDVWWGHEITTWIPPLPWDEDLIEIWTINQVTDDICTFVTVCIISPFNSSLLRVLPNNKTLR